MARSDHPDRHRCGDCGTTTLKWSGRCPACGAWNSLAPETVSRTAAGVARLAEVDTLAAAVLPTRVGELDRVLGGGFTQGSVTLLGGEPGIGKSTLLLQAASALAKGGRKVLYVSAEESAAQVAARAGRLGGAAEELWICSEADWASIEAAVSDLHPAVVVLDSVQTVSDAQVAGAAGSVAQVRACAQRCVEWAKRSALTVVLVGHVTKDGTLAGPKTLEHMVDTVLSFEADEPGGLRSLRAVKHRFGRTGELGLFEMGRNGLHCVGDASGLFLADRRPGQAGDVVTTAMDGRRPLMVEVQALTARASAAGPKRSCRGTDCGRTAALLAVLARHGGVDLSSMDVFVSAVGGARAAEPAADLAIAVAIVSSMTGLPPADDLVILGEVGLGGEIRQARQAQARLAEARRAGFRRALLASSTEVSVPGMEQIKAPDIATALSASGVLPRLRRAVG